MPDDEDFSGENETTGVRNLRDIKRGVAELIAGQQVIARVDKVEGTILVEVQNLGRRFEKFERSLHGDGDGKSGLVARVVALEAGAERWKGWVALGVSVISALAAILAAYFAHRP
jgi:hypothetical protein